jgi:NAD(P)H-dependent FMN reductase
MKIAIISGSHRKNSESERVGRYIDQQLKTLLVETFFFSLAENPLPLWDEGVWEDAEKWQKVWSPISTQLAAAEGFVIISPEWSGMVPAGLKNFFLLCGSNELAHKAGMIVAVSSGIGGTYPVNELRTSSYKNTRLCYIPDHIIVRNCKEMLKDANPTNKYDISLRERILYSLKVLVSYTAALGEVRKSKVIDLERYPNGM